MTAACTTLPHWSMYLLTARVPRSLAEEIVCLSGAHAVGRCHTDRSGFWGPWTYAEAGFSNDYFKFLLEKKWTVKTTHNGKSAWPLVAAPPPGIAAW